MTQGKDILKLVSESKDYNFLKENELLKENVILLGLGGSHAYGMNKENSDIDIRGIALNSKEEILLGKDFEQVVDVTTDTTVYSFKKIVSLLTECNPNTIEILGLRPEQYLFVKPEGQVLIDNLQAFLSKRAFFTFTGYANQQLRRLENKVDKNASQPKHIRHILETLNHAKYTFDGKYDSYSPETLELVLSDHPNKTGDKQILLNFNCKNYPLEEFVSMFTELKNINDEYNKIGKRNKKAIEHDKLGKHMAHLLRLYFMLFDIAEEGVVRTYREKEHDLLMAVRNNEYLDENLEPIPEFYKIVDDLNIKTKKLMETSKLPDNPDYKTINKILCNVNEDIVKKN